MTHNGSFKNFSHVALGRIVTAGLFGIFYLTFATFLDPDTYGQMSYFIAIAGTASIISRFGLPLSVTVYRAKEKHVLANQANVLSVITTGAASIILLSIDLYAALLCFALSSFLMNQHNFLGLKKYKKFFGLSITRGIFVITIPVLFYFILDLPGILIGLALANFLGSIDFFKSLSRKVQSFRDLRVNRKVLLHNFGVESSSALSRWVDKLLIVPLYGFAIVGVYQFNLQILFVFMTIPNAFYSFLLSEKSSGSKQKRMSYLVILVAVLLVSVIIITSPFLIEQFFPKYIQGTFALQILIISLIPLSFTAIFHAELQAKESTRVGYGGVIKIGSLLIFITIFGNIFGLLGLSMAVLLSSSLETIFLAVIFRMYK